MPVVVVTAVRLRTPSSQLLLPLAFAAYAGSLLALTGTPINVIVSKAAAYAGIANSASSSSRSSACPWWPESSRSHCCSVPAAAVAQPTGDAARLHRGRRSVPHPGGDRREPMVLSPGGYRFGDYWKLGLLMLAWFLLVAVRGSADLEVLMATGAPDDPDTLPVLPSGSIPAAPERPATAQPGVLRRLVRPPFSYAGATVALLFFWLSLTPSLLPRAPLFSGAVGGVTAMTGYGVGAALGALSHRLLRWRPPVAGRRTWLVLAVVAVVGTPLVLWQAARWQDGLRALIGLEPESATGPVTIVLVAAVVSGVILLVVRLIGVFGGWTTRQVGRFLPPRLAAALGAVLTVVVLVGFAQGFLWRGFVAAMDRVASVADAGTDEGASRPRADPLRSGSDASLVAWESLGRMGRRFVGFGPTLADLRRFDPPGCCKTPVRVYVGLDDGDSAQERAAIAVRELDRTGGFRRKVLAIYTVTGTGWVNPRAADGLEYLYGGDTAQVSIQYSHLPSWLSFLVDQTRAAEAGRALIGAVRQRLEQIPPAQRPRLLLYGESLGSYGSEEAFRDLAELQSATDGALLVGPTFSNPMWRHLTDTRTPGSPEWLPVTAVPGVRFARAPADLVGMPAPPPAHLVYLQNSSDPITWWSRSLALRRPDWTRPPPPPDRAPGFRWWPLVTFWQTAADLVDSLGVPTGYGHNFGSNVVDGWVALHRPTGWTDADTARLKTLVYESR